jgi:hypothetical protein
MCCIQSTMSDDSELSCDNGDDSLFSASKAKTDASSVRLVDVCCNEVYAGSRTGGVVTTRIEAKTRSRCQQCESPLPRKKTSPILELSADDDSRLIEETKVHEKQNQRKLSKAKDSGATGKENCKGIE